MSETPVTSMPKWEILTRRVGDVLAARAGGQGVELVLLSRSAGHDQAQI